MRSRTSATASGAYSSSVTASTASTRTRSTRSGARCTSLASASAQIEHHSLNKPQRLGEAQKLRDRGVVLRLIWEAVRLLLG